MKSLPPLLAAHYASGGTTLARLWKCKRLDGQVFGFTDHDQPLTYDGVTYAPTSGFTASALKSAADFSIDNLELDGLLDSEAITAEDIEAGLWDGSEIILLEVNWAALGTGANVLRVGTLGEIQHAGPTYTAELRGLLHRLQNNIGRVVGPGCDAQLGDARCKVNLDALRISATVTAVASHRDLTASALAAYFTDTPSGYFGFGEITWTSGSNVGTRIEVQTHSAGGVLKLALAMPRPILVGDAFTIVPGCDRSKAVCKSKFNNVPNFRGFSFVPGNDKVLLVGGQ